MTKLDKYFNICVTVVSALFALTGLVITIAGWIVPDFDIEYRIGFTIFGFGFLFVPCLLIIYMVWVDK